MSAITEYWLWVFAMTAALVYPVGRLIWVLSVRRLQRRLKTELSANEVIGQKKRAYAIAAIVSLLFSCLFFFEQVSSF